ncbi:MAG: carboxypeptidase-like regulatory domain-containing protein [Pseudobdellovibrio sp.]
MKFRMILKIALFGLVIGLTGCNKDKKGEEPTSQLVRFLWTEKADVAAAQIKVINQYGEAVVGAQVLIGDAQGSPFRGNFILTDKSGAAVVPTLWEAPASVTVDAKGYIRQTLLNVKPGNITLKLNSAYLAERAELRGQVTGLPVVNGDKLIDFALVMPAVSKSDLLNFDIGQVISPYSDKLSAAGQENDIPSNISIPKQKESYFISVTLDKPVYRLKVPTLGPKRFVTARGRFVFKDVVKELRDGKPFHELINYFTIHGGSMREATLVDAVTNLDIPGTDLEFKNTIAVNSANAQADEVLLVLATSELSGTMIPTDVKRAVNGKPTALQSLVGSPAFVISVIKKQAEFMANTPGADRMSASLVPFVAGATQKLLPLMANPSITTTVNYVINLAAVQSVEGINAIATSAVISDLVETQDGDKKIITTNRKWDIIGLGWNQQINLPKWPLDNATGRKRVEVNFIGSTTSKSTNLDDSLIQNATHVTHASTDF